jgi:hypothetical protein
MHRSGADACWSRALTAEFIAMQQSMAAIQLAQGAAQSGK